jgi:peptidoglycan glycosyltransferase
LLQIARRLGRGRVVDRSGIVLATSERTDLATFAATYRELGLDDLSAEPRRGAQERYYPLQGYAFHLLGDLNTKVGWGAPNSSYLERDHAPWLQGYSTTPAPAATLSGDGGSRVPAAPLDHSALLPLLRHGFESKKPAVQALLQRDRTLHSTIDARFQVAVAKILRDAVGTASAERGAAVVLDAQTGAVLALASLPWPALAGLDRVPSEALLDRVRYGIYPPGSTFKVVTAMAAQREGVEDRTYRCERLPDGRVGQQVRGWGKPIRDDLRVRQPHGEVDLERGIAVSCNAYFAQLAVYDVGARPLLEVAAELGIETATPNTPAALQDALPQAGYGQGQVVASPLSMARVAATVAADGMAPEGYWVEGESNRRTASPRRLISSAQAARLAAAMRRVVTEGSASRALATVRPAMAGKTGTAEVDGEKSHAWFVGFAPYGGSGRRIAVAVLIENGGYGGLEAAAAAGRIVREAAALGVL